MVIIKNESLNPYFNMAMEEYLLYSGIDDDIFMLWRNSKAVIIGVNQNAYTEVNTDFTEKNNIAVVRRLTGGGAVFHDSGNLNYTFITRDTESGALNFGKFCAPIINALSDIGLEASLSGRNDITVNGYKISGSAQCVKNGRVMHHGTLLWSADFSDMSGALNPDKEKLESKGIKSIRSRVANLRDLLTENQNQSSCAITSDSDITDFKSYLEGRFNTAEVKNFTENEIEKIKSLAEKKYSTWEWNFGKSGAFASQAKKRFSYGNVEIGIESKNGIITDIHICGDFFGRCDIYSLAEKLTGTRLVHSEIEKKLVNVEDYIHGANTDDILNLIFECV